MSEISILLPSLRPQAVFRSIDEFLLTNPGVDYEIVVVSPFKVEGDRVIHIVEEKRQGVIQAMNQAYKRASGEHIVVWSDDASPENNCLQCMLDFVKSHDAPFIAGFRLRDIKGKELEQWSVYGKLYVGWLCASKKTFDAVGGLFDSRFKNYWADPDLSLRVWGKEGKVAVCQDAWIKVAQIDDKIKKDNLSAFFDADTEVFFNRWHDEFGKGLTRNWIDINLPVPCSIGGRIRAILRKAPYLRKIKYSVMNLIEK